jgi:two-component system sensor histidine kinase DesK
MFWAPRHRYNALQAFFASVWLLFLVMPISDLLGHWRGPGTEAQLAGMAVFVMIYIWSWLRVPEGRRLGVAVWCGALTFLAAFLCVANLGDWWSLYIYVSAAVAGHLRWRLAALAVASVALLALAQCRLEGAGPLVTLLIILEVPLIGLMVIASAGLARANLALLDARGEVAGLAVADERLRFARDLHDLLGHSLSVIVLKAELAGKLAKGSPERAMAESADIEKVARDALREVREAVAGYREANFAQELQQARSVLAAAGIEVRMEQPETPPESLESLLAWALREGVTNVIRHAGATTATIRLRRADGRAELELTDDGRGASGFTPGNGLRGLRERVTERHGDVEFGRAAEGGFRLRVSVPL